MEEDESTFSGWYRKLTHCENFVPNKYFIILFLLLLIRRVRDLVVKNSCGAETVAEVLKPEIIQNGLEIKNREAQQFSLASQASSHSSD